MTFRRASRFVLTAAVGLLIGSSLSTAVMRAQATPPAVRTGAPDFSLADSKGTMHRLSDYKGRVVLLDFWATWCAGCKVEIPWFVDFARKYRRDGLVVIGAAMDEDGWTQVTPYVTAHEINYPIVLGYPTLMQPYKLTALPVTLLIDRKGRIVDRHAGIVDRDAWERQIGLLLAEPRD